MALGYVIDVCELLYQTVGTNRDVYVSAPCRQVCMHRRACTSGALCFVWLDFVDVVALHHGLVLVRHVPQELVHVAVDQRQRVRLHQLQRRVGHTEVRSYVHNCLEWRSREHGIPG